MQRNCPSCWGTGRLTRSPFDECGKDPQSHALIYGRPCDECGGSGVERLTAAVVKATRGVIPWDDVIAVTAVALGVAVALVVLLLLS